MGSLVNQKMYEEIKKEFEANPYAFISSFEGIPVAEMSELRRNLQACAVRSILVKHSVARKALESLNLGDASKLFKGNVLVTLGQKEPQEISKKLVDFAGNNKKFAPCGVVFEKQIFDEQYVKSLSKLPSRKELLTQVVVRVKSPISGFVITLNQVVRGIAVVLNEVKKKKEAAGGAAA